MNILVLTPHNQEIGVTPEERVAYKLMELGHDVIIKDFSDELPDAKIDVIASLSEVTAENAFNLAKMYGLPFYAHAEWLPVFRVFIDSEHNWGYMNKIDYPTKMYFIRLYQRRFHFWKQAHVKSLSAKTFFGNVREFEGEMIPIETKYLGPDTDIIKDYKNENKSTKEDAIVCIGRFVPEKRFTHILKALQLANYKGKVYFVGYGPEQEGYEMIKGDLDLEIVPSTEKFNILNKSKLCIALWSGIVPAEAFYFDIPVITYDSGYMKELFGDTLIYAQNNNIIDLKDKIVETLNKTDEERLQLAQYGVSCIENGLINTLTLDNSAKYIESLLEKTIKEAKK